MKNIHFNFTLIFICFSFAVNAQKHDFSKYDTNKDNNMDQKEFNKMYLDSYNAYDSDRDGKITDREFYDNSFIRLDKDKDGRLDNKEWKNGFDNMYKDHMKSDKYSDYDENDDKYLSNDEYVNSFRKSDYYSSYDINNDKTIDTDELNNRTFKNWDKNRDGMLDKNELDHYHPYYMEK